MFSSSSRSSSMEQCGVFVNFTGDDDTCSNFVSLLYGALSNAGVKTFSKSQEVSTSSSTKTKRVGVKWSDIALVVFSQNYAESAVCLEELEQLLVWHKDYGQVVLPIFYDVNPSHVREQTGAFGQKLEELAEKRIGGNGVIDLLLRWGKILNQTACFPGWDVTSCRDQAEQATEEIVNDVLEMLENPSLLTTKFPVGLEFRVQQVIGFVTNNLSRKVCVVGIWGMGGLGKTTIAKEIYNRFIYEYKNKSFIQNIGQICEEHSRQYIILQEQLSPGVVNTEVEVLSTTSGTSMIKRRLCGKTAFIVLDNVTELEQLNALCRNSEWMGPRSVLIVTTRDKSLLNSVKVDCVFEVEEMNEHESLELFSWHAFREASPKEEFNELSRNVVAYCGGLPLVLEILGSYLNKRKEEEWKSVLSKLKKIPSDQVIEKLRISYDGLNKEEQKIFLGICCFFIGNKIEYVKNILKVCGFYSKIEANVLIEMNLVKVERRNKFGIHDLLCDMGREIICHGLLKRPMKHDSESHNHLTKTLPYKNFKELLGCQDLLRLGEMAIKIMGFYILSVLENTCQPVYDLWSMFLIRNAIEDYHCLIHLSSFYELNLGSLSHFIYHSPSFCN